MPNDVADWSQHVTVDAGTVSISGTPAVTISGTPTVSISGPVSISGTVPVTISSGSVTIANASIAVINASGTKITSSRPPQQLGLANTSNGNPVTINLAVPADAQALAFVLSQPLADFQHLKVTWHPLSGGSHSWVPLEVFQFSQAIWVVPILPSVVDTNGNRDATIDVTLQANAVAHYCDVWAIFEPNPLWLEYFAPPFAEPNQPPLHQTFSLTGAHPGGTYQWLLAPATNISIYLHALMADLFFSSGVTGWYIGHASSLPASGSTPVAANILAAAYAAKQIPSPGTLLFTDPVVFPFDGVKLPTGDGVWVVEQDAATATFDVTMLYSLA